MGARRVPAVNAYVSFSSPLLQLTFSGYQNGSKINEN